MPPSAIVDASVLVSALLFPGSLPGQVLKVAAQGRFALRLSPILLDETRDALLLPRLERFPADRTRSARSSLLFLRASSRA